MHRPFIEIPGQERNRITLRSVLLGSVAVGTIAGLAPYNDFVVENTFLIGSYLPVGVILILLVLTLGINAPLRRFAPKRALSGVEMSTILAMMLIGCSLPTMGLLRFWIPSLVAPFYFGVTDAQFWSTFAGMRLPNWLFPIADRVGGRTSPVAMGFYNRLDDGQTTPFRAWLGPVFGWSPFLIGWAALLVSMAAILLPQWSANERLPFPLATLQLGLIEPPEPGRSVNKLLRDPRLWIAAGAVFALHSANVLHEYFGKTIPRIPLGYDLTREFSERPWILLNDGIKSNRICFILVGVSYFLQTRVSFSLWACFLIVQGVTVFEGSIGKELPQAAMEDQHLGSALMFALAMVWFGRHHLKEVLRHAVLGRSVDECLAGVRSYAPLVYLGLAGLMAMLAWLIVAGTSWPMALLIVAVIVLAQLVIARVVAETGLPFMRMLFNAPQLYTLAPPNMIDPRDAMMAGLSQSFGTLSSREGLMPFAMHAMRVGSPERTPARPRTRLLLALGWSLLLSFAVGTASSLWCYYNFPTPLGKTTSLHINPLGIDRPKDLVVDAVNQAATGSFKPRGYNPFVHFGLGAALTGVLFFATSRWAWWPFMPVGYLVCMNMYIWAAWFSVMLGWLCKVLIVRFGGASTYQWASSIFVGMILGEAMVSGFWLVVNLVLAWNGIDYHAVSLLPA